MNTSDEERIIQLERRLANTEKALLAFWSILEGLQPPSAQEDVNNMLESYANANTSLGSEIYSSGTQFITGD